MNWLSALGFGLAAFVLPGAESREPKAAVPHLMPEGNGSTRLVGNKAYTLISVPVAVLTGFDDDGNGAISVLEARVHHASLTAQIERRVLLYDGTVLGRTIYQDLQVPHYDSSSAVQSYSVIQIRVSEWDTAPKSLRLRADIFTRNTPDLRFRAIMGDSTETATLRAGEFEHSYFAPKPPTPMNEVLGTLAVLMAIATALGVAMMFGKETRQA
jgi:hypothetical protein